MTDPNEIIRWADGSFYGWPQMKWSFNHIEQLVPTKSVWRGPGAARELPASLGALDHLELDLEASDTDALAVMHRGRLIYERYLGHSDPHRRHTLMSCNKSMVGTIAECLIEDGTLDDSLVVTTYVPELADSAWADASVRQVLDMTISMDFDEDYMNPKSDVWRFVRSTGMVPGGPDDPATIAEFLPSVKRGPDPHGETFAYREPNIFVLGWTIRRAAKADVATLASELVWQQIGAEHDWLYMVDARGVVTTASATLRDFVRFGQLFVNGGAIDGEQQLPSTVVERLLAGGDQAVFANGDMPTLPDWSYRSQWWYRHVGGRICPTARGAHGQMLYIDPANDLIIARFGSSQHPPSALLDPIMWPMVDLITSELSA